MAQLVISTIDPEHGSISSVIHLKDKDLQRIYNAYKRDYAEGYLKHKIDQGEVLEASDSLENIQKDIQAQEILNDLVERFIKDIVNVTHSTEMRIAYEKISSNLERIQVRGDS